MRPPPGTSRALQEVDRSRRELFANADRFGPAGTAIDVDVGPGGPKLVAVRVRDHGPGVEPELRPRLFERFVHGPAEDGSVQPVGTGLGLSIVKGLIEAHAGTVVLEASDGGGASFRFTLTVAEEAT